MTRQDSVGVMLKNSLLSRASAVANTVVYQKTGTVIPFILIEIHICICIPGSVGYRYCRSNTQISSKLRAQIASDLNCVRMLRHNGPLCRCA